MRQLLRTGVRAVLAFALASGAQFTWAGMQPESTVAAQERLAAVPLAFEPNQGQHDARIRYVARTKDYRLLLTPSGAILSAPSSGAVELRFEHANRAPQLVPAGILEQKTHYLRGAGQNHTNIPNYGRVTYRNVYEGVDVVFYGQGGKVEYDFVLQPGADVRRIQMTVRGADRLELAPEGDLLIHSAAGVFRQHKPVVYQEHAGRRERIDAAYRVRGGKIGFVVAAYDRSRPLTIDPILSYSTYLGATLRDEVVDIAVDAAGHAYLTGTTTSVDFPVLNAYQSTGAGDENVFVTKLNPQGTGIVYSTYIGGRRSRSNGKSIAVDAAGAAYVTGLTNSNTYPATAGAYSAPILASGFYVGFLTKLAPAGNALAYSTYLPGTFPEALALDSGGNAYVAGGNGGGFVASAGAYQTSGPGVVLKINAAGSARVYGTFLGGSGSDSLRDIAVDGNGNAYVLGEVVSTDFPTTVGALQRARAAGWDASVTKLNSTGTQLVYSTYLGGNADDTPRGIAVDASGKAYVAGSTDSTNFPGLPSLPFGPNRGFIVALMPDGSSLAWASYFANGLRSGARAVAVDPSGTNLYVGGDIYDTPSGAVDPVQGDRINDTSASAYIVKFVLNPFTGKYATAYSTPLGGSNWVNGIAHDRQGNVYVAGYGTATSSSVLPVTPGAFRLKRIGDNDSFVAKLSTLGRPVTLDGGCGDARGAVVQLRATTALDAAGSVSFMEGGATLATVAIANGMASFTAPAAVGVHTYTAVRSSDGAVSAPLYCKVDQ